MDRGREFTPRLDILPPPQRQLWDELAGVPAEFVLYGGTAIALHLGHRNSLDFDFFGDLDFDPGNLLRRMPFMKGAEITQQGPNTLSGIVNRNGAVKVSFFGLPEIPRLQTPHVAPDSALKVASLLDLAGMKAAVVQQRAEAKDYIDIDALIEDGRVDLPTALGAGRAIYGTQFNPEITLKALCFFDDGNLHTLPEEVKVHLREAVKAVDLDRLPVIEGIARDDQQKLD